MILKNKSKNKTTGINKSQKSFLKENKHMLGWNPKKPSKQDGNDTTTLFTPSLHLVPFCQLCTPQTLMCTHCWVCVACWSVSYVVKFYCCWTWQAEGCGVSSGECIVCCTPQLLHTRQIMSAMLSSNYVTATHNTTHSSCTSTCTTHPAIPNPLPSATLLCTQLTQGIVGKQRKM